MKEFRAYSKDGSVIADTPKNAASLFFARFPTKRKCNIIEGVTDGHFFTVRYGRSSEGDWPYSAKDVTKKTIETL